MDMHRWTSAKLTELELGHRKRVARLPPGPKGLDALEFLQAGLAPPGPVLMRLAAKYGDPFRVRYLSGPVTFTGHPEALRAIYSAEPSAFDVWGTKVVAPVFGTTSVVVSSGERHRRDRKLMTPAFNGSSMRAFGGVIAELASSAAARWPVDRPFSMLETSQEITLDIMVRVVFGVRQEERIQRARGAVLELIASLHPLIFMFPFLRRSFGGVGPWARNCRAVSALNVILREEIAARREAHHTGKDILSLMMLARYDDGSEMSEPEILDHLRGLLFAGHEATSVAMAWTFYWLHREPGVLARVMSEIDALGPDPEPDALASLPYLEAVCQEVLRLYPPVVDAARIARAPIDLVGFTVPAGEAIRPSIQLLHARPEIYPEPLRFRPERFLERRYSIFEYAPFGGGARRCLGSAFALYEMKVALGTMLRAHRLRLVSEEPVAHARRGLTMGPEGGVRMIAAPRVAAPRPAAILEVAR